LRIPEHKIEEVRERVDIVALISRHVELKKSGRSFKGRCPFHEEKTASFYVTPDMGRFHCFGCQSGGDAIAFVQRYLGKSFVDSVRDLAREAGVELELVNDPSAAERQPIKEVTDLAQEHFRARLWGEESGRKAREYLTGRGVVEQTARSFGLGWAPGSWNELTEKLLKAGVLEWGIKAGLVQKRASAEGYYDVFRGRLIIPIRSSEGRTIAFGGRLLEGEDGPKYLNSKESVLYHKSDTLYGLDQAREEIRRRKCAVLVEGYFDCIALHAAGLKNAVALCSTALTASHLSALSRSDARELILLLDGDEAGRGAVERLAGCLLASGANAKVALLPQDEDPDTFVRKAGVEQVQALISNSRSLSEYLFVSFLPEGESASFEKKMLAIERVRPISAQLPVGLTRSVFLGSLAAHIGLPAVELEAVLKGRLQVARPVPKPSPSPSRPPTPLPSRPPDPSELAYVAMLLREPSLLSQDGFRTMDELRHPGLRSVAAELAAGGGGQDALFEAPDSVKEALQEASRQLPEKSAALQEAFAHLCRRLKLRRIDDQLAQVAKATGQVLTTGDWNEDVRRLQTERIELLALKKRVVERAVAAAPAAKSPAFGV
jgi:DNA primase